MPLSELSLIPRGGKQKLHLEVSNTPECCGNWSVWRLNLGPELACVLAVEAEGATVRLGKWPCRNQSASRFDG